MSARGNLLDRILRALGFNPVRLRWKLNRFKERSKRRGRSLENRSRALRYEHKVCANCGLTVDRVERRCPRCGERLPGMAGRRLGFLWRALVPAGKTTYTTLFVTAIVVLHLAMVVQSGGAASLGHGISVKVMFRFGAWTVPSVLGGELWRLVVPCFLHFGLLHLIFNGLWLVQLGPLVEQTYGRSRFLLIYLVSGVAGNALSVLYRSLGSGLAAPAIGAGASGVVFGLIGVALAQGYLKKTPNSGAFRGGIGKWALYAIVFSLLPGVDMVAHLGGGLAGAALGWGLADSSQQRSHRPWLVVEGVCVLVLVGSFVRVVVP